ncbi:glycosyltransferase [Cyanobium sp. FGCU-52]|nr:glycosyltransferase [Cyanobium sp. FGCU52]
MNTCPLVSVITPCLNAERTISDTLRSVAKAAELLGDSGWTLEHLIVDGGSRDETHKVVVNHSEENRLNVSYGCNWCAAPNEGIYESMNIGLAQAKGYFSHVLNADDFLHDPSAYVTTLRKAYQHGARILLSSIVYFTRPGPKWKYQWHLPPIPHDEEIWRYQLLAGLHYPHPGFIADTELYRSEGFDERYAISADYKLMQSLLLKQGIHKHVYGCDMPFAAMATGGTSGTWRGMIKGHSELRAINDELGIRASITKRYWSKLNMRIRRLSKESLFTD